jgi:hypothetical protein
MWLLGFSGFAICAVWYFACLLGLHWPMWIGGTAVVINLVALPVRFLMESCVSHRTISDVQDDVLKTMGRFP